MIVINEKSKTNLKNQWITAKGSHYHVDKNGNVDIPNNSALSNNTKSDNKSNKKSNKKSINNTHNNEPSELAKLIAKGITNAGKFAEKGVRNLSHN